ncbi:hypothetical protein LVB87_15455 [Lysobacter sp. KIS68-7]|uniref:hypothetical protein n=1 Tax=Lysobacter sp. KIS68-7 TaxID=2904252 RepID=UPI001E351BC9|nr:hypothetical protein [Lysobacter sp. KIS68-7]UHQ19563.1 hypothetical protein LVB87_15455 [Lysobacter sp. KIS68-7]
MHWLDAHRIAVLQVAGPQVLQASVARVATAIDGAAGDGAKAMVVDLRDIEGIDPPDLGARHAIVRQWAEAARSRVRLGLVVRPEFIDPDKFSVVAAANFGLVMDVFETRAEALDWLRREIPPPA